MFNLNISSIKESDSAKDITGKTNMVKAEEAESTLKQMAGRQQLSADHGGIHQIDGSGVQSDKPAKSGDINQDGKTDKKDLQALTQVLNFGDMNKDGKVDRRDFDLLNNKIIESLFNPTKSGPTKKQQQGDVNKDGKVDYNDLQLMYQAMKYADMDYSKTLDRKDLIALNNKIKPSLRVESTTDNEKQVVATPKDGDINEDGSADIDDSIILAGLLYMAGSDGYRIPRLGTISKKDFYSTHNDMMKDLFSDGHQPLHRLITKFHGYGDLQQMYQAMKHGDMNGDKVLDKTDLDLIIDDNPTVKEIGKLTQSLLSKPDTEQMNALMGFLGKYTKIPSSPKDINMLNYFFKNPIDANGDGQVNQRDIIMFWLATHKK